MASVVTYQKKQGLSYGIQFRRDNKRECICFSQKYNRRQVEGFTQIVEFLLVAEETGRTLTAREQNQVDDLPNEARRKFAEKGLIGKFERLNLGQLWERFQTVYAKEKRLKESTLLTYRTVERRFFRRFDRAGNPNELTKSICYDWLESLEDGLAEASIAGTVQRCRTVLGWGVEKGFTSVNPFTGISDWSFQNKENERFIPKEWYNRLLDASPDQTWRTLISLCRYGGLRNPSETLRLQWSDVNWETGTMLVHSPKTARYKGKESRLVPLYPEVRTELEKQFEQAEPGGSPFVIDHWRDTSANLRTHFQRIIFRAGLEEWPRLFHNLRRSRSNEIFSLNPAYVAEEWMGQSAPVAKKHYLSATPDQISRAAQQRTEEIFKNFKIFFLHKTP